MLNGCSISDNLQTDFERNYFIITKITGHTAALNIDVATEVFSYLKPGIGHTCFSYMMFDWSCVDVINLSVVVSSWPAVISIYPTNFILLASEFCHQWQPWTSTNHLRECLYNHILICSYINFISLQNSSLKVLTSWQTLLLTRQGKKDNSYNIRQDILQTYLAKRIQSSKWIFCHLLR